MTKRLLVIEIDAEKKTCGKCALLLCMNQCELFGRIRWDNAESYRHSLCIDAEERGRGSA